MEIPENLKYTEDHEWCQINDDIMTIGVTDFAQSELGDIVFIEVETKGEELEKNEVFGSIEAVKTVSDLFMPVAGEVIEFNEAIEEEPEIVNNSPYKEGWIIKVKMNDPSNLEGLINAEEYKNLIGQ